MSGHKYRCERGPLFFGVANLLLESSGETIAEELTAAIEQEGFAGIQSAAQRSLLGSLFQFAGQIQSHLDNLTLQRRTGQER
jgi:hypothetical protein